MVINISLRLFDYHKSLIILDHKLLETETLLRTARSCRKDTNKKWNEIKLGETFAYYPLKVHVSLIYDH